MKKRAAIIVLDSVGIGAMPDAGELGMRVLTLSAILMRRGR